MKKVSHKAPKVKAIHKDDATSAGESQAQVIIGENENESFDVGSVFFLPDGTSLMSLTSEEVLIWDTVTKNLIHQAEAPWSYLSSVAISPDAKLLAVDRLLWSVENRERITNLGELPVLIDGFFCTRAAESPCVCQKCI